MCKILLPQYVGWRVEHGSEAKGNYSDRKGEARRKRLRCKRWIAEVWIWKVSCCVFYFLLTEALSPGGKLLRVSKAYEAQETQKATRSTRPIAKVIKAVTRCWGRGESPVELLGCSCLEQSGLFVIQLPLSHSYSSK